MRSIGQLRRYGGAVMLAGLLVMLAATMVRAQSSGGTFRGRVQDQGGGALPFAPVTITNSATGIQTNVVTNGEGFFSAPNQLPGAYDVSTSYDGFDTQTRKGVTLTVGSEVILDFSMSIGGLQESLIVSGTAATVDTSSAAIKRNVDGKTIRELPLNGRDWTQLAMLQPGVTGIGTQGGSRSGNGMKMAVSGARPTENSYRLNGISVNDYANNTPGSALGTNLGVEAIAEFTVLTNGYSAEYGRTSGGVINAVTRSGANNLTGTIFNFTRNSKMDAKNYFDQGDQPPPFYRVQYGAAFGGPLVKNRTFWFGDYEGLRENLNSTDVGTTLSDNARRGLLAGGPVVVDPKIARILNLYPRPNGSLLGNGDTAQAFQVTERTSRGDYALLKVDHRVTKAGTFGATYLFDDASVEQPSLFLTRVNANNSRRSAFITEYSQPFSSAVVSVSRFGIAKALSEDNKVKEVLNPILSDVSLGYIPGYSIGSVIVPGLSTVGGGPGSVDFSSEDFASYQWSQDIYVLRGSHALKFGGNVEYMQHDYDVPNLSGGSFNFGTLAGFLRNQPIRFGTLFPQSDTTRRNRQTLFGGYVQDDYRVHDNLTLNLGLRYEMVTIPTEVDDKVAKLRNLTDPQVTVGGPVLDSNPTLKNFAPRLGMAWDPFGTQKMSVRAGFGVFDVLPLLYLFETPLARSGPFFLQGNINNPPAGSFPNQAFDLLSARSLRTAYVDPNPKRAYRTQWNVNVQRQFGVWTAEVGYLGGRGYNLPLVERNMNTVMPTKVGDRWVYPSRSTSQRLNENFSAINTTVTWNAISEYQALQTLLRRNFSRGVQAQVSYTLSQSIDTGSSISSVSSGTGYESSFSVATPLLPELARGPSNYDVPHNVVGSVLWAIPSSSALPGIAKALLQGWEFAAVYRFQTGYPFTPAINGDRAGSKADTVGSALGQPPDWVGGPGCDSGAVNPGNVINYIKTECFAFPPDGVLGNLGRNTLRSPNLATLDLVLTKTYSVGGQMKAQFRLEVFNALNRANFATPSNVVIFDNNGNIPANAGVIASTRTTARQTQLGVKLTF